MVDVIPRSVWGARHEDGGGPATVPFTEWWLHHSVTIAPDLVPPFTDEYAAMRTLEDIGEQRFGRGISYTWPIMPNGRVYQGHSVNRLGAHTGGRNGFARAICLVGNYDAQTVTAAQIESAAQLMVQEFRAGRARRYTLNGGHRQLKATSCPGNNGFTAIPLINARATALMAGAPPLGDDMSAEDVKQINEWTNFRINQLAGFVRGELRAEVVGRIAGLAEVVKQLAENQGTPIDMDALEAVVEKGVADAIAGIEATVTVKPSA